MIKVKFNENMIVVAERYIHSNGGRSGFIRAIIHDREMYPLWRSNDTSQYVPAIESIDYIQYQTDLILCHELLVVNDPESSHFYIVKYPYPNDIKIYKSHVTVIDERERIDKRERIENIPLTDLENILKEYPYPLDKDNRDNNLWDKNLDNLFDKDE